MKIDATYKRRIHIMGKPDETRGYMLKVYDAETSEEITNIFRIELLIDVKGHNQAKVTYYEFDKQGKMVIMHGQPVEGTVTVDNPSLSLTAYELAGEEDGTTKPSE